MSGLFNKGREVGCESGLRRMAVTCTAAIVAVCAATGAAPTNAHAETGSAAVAWGFNQRWQLGAGYGTTRGEDTPVPVVGLSNITAVAEFNARAIKVYERAGFRVTGRHTRYFEGWGDVPFIDMQLDA